MKRPAEEVKSVNFVSVGEAAKASGLSEYELRRGIRAGEYPAIFIGDGQKKRIKVNQSLLDSVLEERAMKNAYK